MGDWALKIGRLAGVAGCCGTCEGVVVVLVAFHMIAHVVNYTPTNNT